MTQPLTAAALDVLFYAAVADVAAGPILAALVIYFLSRPRKPRQ